MMNIIISASPIQADYLGSLLTNIGIKWERITQDRSIQQSLSATSGLPKIDLAIVDPVQRDAEIILNNLNQLKIPVVLLLGGNTKNWENLFRLNAYGYLQIDDGPGTLTARLKAITRRFKDHTPEASGPLAANGISDKFVTHQGIEVRN